MPPRAADKVCHTAHLILRPPTVQAGQISLDLINGEHFDEWGRRLPQDLLDNPAWLAAWTQYWHLSMTSPPDVLAEAVLRAVRALLRRMMEGIATQHPLADTQLEELEYLSGIDACATARAASPWWGSPGEPPVSGVLDGRGHTGGCRLGQAVRAGRRLND